MHMIGGFHMNKRLARVIALAVLTVPLGLISFTASAAPSKSAGLYPDLQTVVPTHLGIQNQQQRTTLRFSNGIANTGLGPWRMRPDLPPTVTTGVQESRDANGKLAPQAN